MPLLYLNIIREGVGRGVLKLNMC